MHADTLTQAEYTPRGWRRDYAGRNLRDYGPRGRALAKRLFARQERARVRGMLRAAVRQ